MRSILLSLTAAAALCGQTATRPEAAAAARPAPGTAAPVGPPAQTPPDKVVAKIDGKNYTAAEVAKIVSDLPAQLQATFRQNPTASLHQLLMLQYFARQAELHGLDKDPEYQRGFEFGKLKGLAQEEITHYRNAVPVTIEEERPYYEQNRQKYEEARVKVIYVSFTPSGAKTAATPAGKTEAEAKAKIEEIRKQVENGEDFSAAAKEKSEDKASAEKGGDFGTIARASQYPEAVKTAIFGLKLGDVSEPVRQPNGFYLFKLVSLVTPSFNDVESKIHLELQQSRFNDWMKSVDEKYKVVVEDPDYFTPGRPR